MAASRVCVSEDQLPVSDDREQLLLEADRRVEELRDRAAALVRARLGPFPRELAEASIAAADAARAAREHDGT